MTLKPLAVVAVLVASVAGARAQGVPRDFVVKLQRTPCFGACPTYVVSIDANGRVIYEGGDNVRIKGRATATITREQVAAGKRSRSTIRWLGRKARPAK